MKKHKFLEKIITCVIAMSLSMMVLAGCGNSSTSTDETTSETTTESSSTTENSSDSNTTDASTTDENTSEVSESERKEKIEEGIQELVDDGTITQDQADAVMEKLAPDNANE